MLCYRIRLYISRIVFIQICTIYTINDTYERDQKINSLNTIPPCPYDDILFFNPPISSYLFFLFFFFLLEIGLFFIIFDSTVLLLLTRLFSPPELSMRLESSLTSSSSCNTLNIP
eukprot:UN34184